MKLLCLDLDNTLVRANKAHILAFKKAFQKNKLEKKTNKEILKVFSLESSVMIRKLYPNLLKKQTKKVAKDHSALLVKETSRYVKAIRGVRTALKKLKKKYKIAILSNCKQKEIFAILKHAKINQSYFDLIIGSDRVKRPKPAPDEMNKAKYILKQKKGYMVGDSIYDIRAGKKAGLKTIAVLTGNHTKKELQKEKATQILKSIADLPEYI